MVKLQNLLFKLFVNLLSSFIKVHNFLTHHGLPWLPETRSLRLNHLTHPSCLICVLSIPWEILGCPLQLCRAVRKAGFPYSLITLFFSHLHFKTSTCCYSISSWNQTYRILSSPGQTISLFQGVSGIMAAFHYFNVEAKWTTAKKQNYTKVPALLPDHLSQWLKYN